MILEVYLAMLHTKKDAGRLTPIASGYRPSIHINGNQLGDCIIELKDSNQSLAPGRGDNAEIKIITPDLFQHLKEGMTICICEGKKYIAVAIIKKIRK